MQGVYQWLLNQGDVGAIQAHVMESDEYLKADAEYFDGLLGGAIRQSGALREQFSAYLDRDVRELSPVEHATLLVAGYELQAHHEVPYRVVINEAVEIAKSFGGTDGFKYVNGVLDKLAAKLRAVEVQATASKKAAKPN